MRQELMNNADNLIAISWKIYWSSILQFEVEHFSTKCAFQFLLQKTSIIDSVIERKT